MKLKTATYEVRGRDLKFELFGDRLEVTNGGVTHVFGPGMDEDMRWKLASHIFKQANGHRGTNSDIHEIYDLANSMQDFYS